MKKILLLAFVVAGLLYSCGPKHVDDVVSPTKTDVNPSLSPSSLHYDGISTDSTTTLSLHVSDAVAGDVVKINGTTANQYESLTIPLYKDSTFTVSVIRGHETVVEKTVTAKVIVDEKVQQISNGYWMLKQAEQKINGNWVPLSIDYCLSQEKTMFSKNRDFSINRGSDTRCNGGSSPILLWRTAWRFSPDQTKLFWGVTNWPGTGPKDVQWDMTISNGTMVLTGAISGTVAGDTAWLKKTYVNYPL